MKKLLLMLALVAGTTFVGIAQEYTQITTIESVVPGGIGRSRMIVTKPDGTLEEVKMKNFFSLVGINFANVQANDKMISEKIMEMAKGGWTLEHVTPGVYAGAADNSSTGIFITRYLFKKG